MAITATPYGKFLMHLGSGSFNLGSDAFKVLLTTGSYVPNVDTHEFRADVTNEISGAGYTAGGKALTTVTWTYDATNKRGVLGADNVLWAGVTFTCRLAVVYRNIGSPATDLLVGYINFGADRVLSAEDFVLSSASGVVRVTAI